MSQQLPPGEVATNTITSFLRQLFPFLTIRSISGDLNEGVRAVIPGRNLPKFRHLRDLFLLTMSIQEGAVIECKVMNKEYWNIRRPAGDPQQQGVARAPPPSLSIRCILSCRNDDVVRVVHRNDLGFQVDPRCNLVEDMQRLEEYNMSRTISSQFSDVSKKSLQAQVWNAFCQYPCQPLPVQFPDCN